ncbi:MAG: acylneuraminate cytidylyltransferase family protein [Spartobacteria bacterium]|nr:acylneuraminate cytidylyltransferase family protein [Spartobacteria bacterium]
MNVLGLIAARGGSKGIPQKNLQPLGRLPLIGHTILAARQAKLLDRFLVSTDDEAIADTARRLGADVPFLRPMEYASDTATSVAVALHALDWLREHRDMNPAFVMLLQPTSPFRAAADIDGAIQLARRQDAQAVVSVTEAMDHPYLAKSLDGQGRIRPFIPTDVPSLRRQDLPVVYVLNGAIYLVQTDRLRETRSWCPPGSVAWIMPPERSLDIDTPWDLRLARLIMQDMDNLDEALI